MKKTIVEKDVLQIRNLIDQVIGNQEILKIERMGGLTNHTYHVRLESGEYVVRIPGEGTEELINRRDEKTSTLLAYQLDIDARLIYFGNDGSKVTEYIHGAETMCAETMRDPVHIRQAAAIFKKLHTCGEDTGVPFEVFDMADGYESIIKKYKVPMFTDYQETKKRVMAIKQEVDLFCDTTRVPCHNDSLCENWIFGNDRMYLIDWEYAGMNDGMWDLADISIEASYNYEQDELLLKNYLECKPDAKTWKHLFANKIYVDYLWTLWAKTRVPFDGQPMEDWALERYTRLKRNIDEFQKL